MKNIIYISLVLITISFSNLYAQIAVTYPATEIGKDQATLNGVASFPGGGVGQVYFLWGTTSLSNTTSPELYYGGLAAFSATIDSLQPDTEYNFIIKVVYGGQFYSGVLGTFTTEKPVVFNDALLKAKVEDELGTTNPSPGEMLNLVNLYAENSNITDLTGLEYAENLTDLSLYGNNISKLEPLTNLTGLNLLFLQNNNIRDIEPLVNMTQLTSLNLRANPIHVDAYTDWLDEIQNNNPNLTDFRYDSFSGDLRVLSPNGFEMLLSDRIQTISWESYLLSNVDISYSIDGPWKLIARVNSPDSTNNKMYWKVPQVANREGRCVIRIAASDYPLNSFGFPDFSDISNEYFSITPCEITESDGDLNYDCIVDINDFAIFAQNWLINSN